MHAPNELGTTMIVTMVIIIIIIISYAADVVSFNAMPCVTSLIPTILAAVIIV